MKVAIILTLFISSSAFAGGSASIAEANKVKILKAANEYNSTKERALLLQEKERKLLVSIYKMTQKQRKLAQQKAQRMEKRESLQADIMHLEKNIQAAGEQINKLKKQIMTRLRNLFRVNSPTIFQSIFGSQDVMEMDRNAKILYKISKADMEQLRTYRGLKNLLDQQQMDLKDKLAEFEKTQKDLENKEAAIKNNYLTQMNLLKKLDSEDKAMLLRMKILKQQARALAPGDSRKDMTVMFEGGIYDQKGKLDLPVSGVVTQKFGLLNLMNDKIKIYHKGWFLTTAPGKSVSSIYKGRVVYKGNMDEFKQVLILDHGDHFYSVYGNLNGSRLAVGDEVDTQQMIGEVDQSRFYGSGLYFEIRHFSQSENPKEWFADGGINISSLKEHSI